MYVCMLHFVHAGSTLPSNSSSVTADTHREDASCGQVTNVFVQGGGSGVAGPQGEKGERGPPGVPGQGLQGKVGPPGT